MTDYTLIWGIDEKGNLATNVDEPNYFVLCKDNHSNMYFMEMVTELNFESSGDSKKYVNNIFSAFTAWMLDNGYDAKKEIELWDVFRYGSNIKDVFDSIEDAYATFKFLVRGFNGV